MTLGDLKQMLRQDVGRADKEPRYTLWVNRAIRALQTSQNWECMRDRQSVTITAGTFTANLPANYKEVTAENYPVTVVDPTTVLTGILQELSCELTSREKMTQYRSLSWVASRPTTSQGRLSGLPVYIQRDPSTKLHTLNTVVAVDTDTVFKVSFYGYVPDLVLDADTNDFLLNYPELVENRVKAIAFAAINDPIASQFIALSDEQARRAGVEDSRMRLTTGGRRLRMGG
jgi:hypothetical protein